VTRRPLVKAILFAAGCAIAVLVYLFLLSALRGKLGEFSKTIPALVLASIVLFLNWRFLKSDNLSLRDIGLDALPLRFSQMALGFLAGSALVVAWAVVLRLVAGALWQPFPFHLAPAGGAFSFIFFNNTGEELVYRAWLFLAIARRWGSAAAVITTCTLFTLLHIQSGIPVMSAIAGVLTTSLIFAALFLRWQSLPLVLGFHVATNFMQEFLGLRITGLTFVAPTNLNGISASQWGTVLIITAIVNMAVAALLFSRQRSHTLSISDV